MSVGGDGLQILHIDTERGWRGGERQVLWLADALEQRGHGNIIAARPHEPLAVRAVERGLGVVPVTPHSELAIRSALRLRRVIRRQRIGIVHAHTGHAVALAALATRGTAAAMVVTRRVIFRLRDNAITRWKYRRADAVIAISRAVAESLAQSGIDPARIAVVPSAVDLGRHVEPASDQSLLSLGVGGRPLVVMVAALTPEKDPVTFVRAVAVAHRQAPSITALLVGEGPMRRAVEAEIARLGCAGVVTLAGLRTDAERLLAAADIVTLTSVQEGLGTVLLDAAMFGKPVVATRVGGIPEIVTHQVSGLLERPGDAEALGAAIASLATNHALRHKLGEGARLRAAEFSLDRSAERTVEVYRSALARARSRQR